MKHLHIARGAGRPAAAVLIAAAWLAPGLRADPQAAADAEAERILAAIAVDAYTLPQLPLKLDPYYAHSAVDVVPYRHVPPYTEHFLEQMEYTGPGRAVPEPERVESVRIGFLGPIMATVSVATGGKSHEEPLGIMMLRGARLAIEETNARGGYRGSGTPFELAVHNDNGLWGASGNEIINMAYKENCWAILGSIDGANSHIAIRVALKIEIPMMNTGDTDPTFIETNIPWVFRCISDDRQQSYLLVDYLFRKLGLTRVAIIRASNRYGRFGVREVRDGSRRLSTPLGIEMAYRLGTEDFSLQLERIKAEDPQAVVHWGDAEDGATILRQMRAMGMQQPFFGCDRHVTDEFLEAAGGLAEGVMCAYPWNPESTSPVLAAFRERFLQRFGVEPDTYAAHAYDGMNMLVWGIDKGGLNRAKIRDMIAYRTVPFPGVTGEIPLSACLDDLGKVFLARVEGGRWKYYSREDLQIPRGYIGPRSTVAVAEKAALGGAAPMP